MDKFEKKLRKLDKNIDNALIIGSGFGKLPEILEVFNTVFVASSSPPSVKSKKIVYIETFKNISSTINVSMIFVDLNQLHRLSELSTVWNRWKSLVLIEGNEPIGREFSRPLYDSNYNCIDVLGEFHIWKRVS